MNTLEKKFRTDKKSITFEDCVIFIEQEKPEEKQWFFALTTETTDLVDKDDKPTGQKGIRPWWQVKKEFYKKFFPDNKELSARKRLMAHWNIEPAAAEDDEDE